VRGVVQRELAHRDVEEAIDHFVAEATAKLTLAFVDEREKTCVHIAHQPASG
jgi:hypothetical protein